MRKDVILSEISYIRGFINEASYHMPFSLPPVSLLIIRVKRSLDTMKAALDADSRGESENGQDH